MTACGWAFAPPQRRETESRLTEGNPMSLANHRAWRASGGEHLLLRVRRHERAGRARQVALPGPDRHAHRDGPGGRASARSRARARLRVVPPALAGVHTKAERAALARTYHEVREPTLATDARRLEVQPDAVAAPATDPRAAQVLALQRTVGNRLAGARSLAASRRRAGLGQRPVDQVHGVGVAMPHHPSTNRALLPSPAPALRRDGRAHGRGRRGGR